MWLMIRINSEEVSTNVIKVLIHIVHQLHEVNKASILDAYLHYVFVTPTLPESAHKATAHEEMVILLISFQTINMLLFIFFPSRSRLCVPYCVHPTRTFWSCINFCDMLVSF